MGFPLQVVFQREKKRDAHVLHLLAHEVGDLAERRRHPVDVRARLAIETEAAGSLGSSRNFNKKNVPTVRAEKHRCFR
jgi:hypothetical protein